MTSFVGPPAGEPYEQYGSFTTEGGDVVIYDTENPTAWLQSSDAVQVGSSISRSEYHERK